MKKTIPALLFLTLFISVTAMAKAPMGGLLDGVEAGPDGKIDILTIFAHQDDESIYGGGAILLAMKDPRVRLHILCLTLGDLSEAKDVLGISGEHLGRIRSEELETAASVYGEVEVIQFKYHDQGLASADQEKLIGEIVRVIESTGAEVVITHDPLGVTGHTDHMTCSRVAIEAFGRSGARVLYHPTLPPSLYRVLMMISPVAGGVAEPALPTFRVDIKSVKKLKRMACYAHASQMRFSDVGRVTEIMLSLRHEYYTLAQKK